MIENSVITGIYTYQRCHSPPKSGRSPPKSCLGGDLGGFLGGVGGDLGGGFGRIYFI